MRLVSYALATTLLISFSPFDLSYAQSTDCAVTGISAEEAPPELPDYEQPPIPAPGYIWTPGYWAWNNEDYYWVPGTWTEPPEEGLLWTPPYWGFVNGAYVFHRGYWGPHVGFYGGVDYGYGYGGRGFEGGHWDHGAFYYNRAVTNLQGAQITNVYEKNVVINNRDRISYNGGPGGLAARPTAEEEAIAREPHRPPTHWQAQHVRAASVDSTGFASTNHGRPVHPATARPSGFEGKPIHETNPAATGAAGHAPHEPHAIGGAGGLEGTAPLHGETPLEGKHAPLKHNRLESGTHNLPVGGGKPVREKPLAHGAEVPAGGVHNPHPHQHHEPGAGAPPHPSHALSAPHSEAAPVHHEAPHHEAPMHMETPHHEAVPHREAPAGHPPGHEEHEGGKKHPGDR
jgi:hypothetical protein